MLDKFKKRLKGFIGSGDNINLVQVSGNNTEEPDWRKRYERPAWKTWLLGGMTGVVAFTTFAGIGAQIAEAHEAQDALMAASHSETLAAVQLLDRDNTPEPFKIWADDLDEMKKLLDREILLIDMREGVSPEFHNNDQRTDAQLAQHQENLDALGPHAVSDFDDNGRQLCTVIMGGDFVDPTAAPTDVAASGEDIVVQAYAVGTADRLHDFLETGEKRFDVKHLDAEKAAQMIAVHEQGHCLDPDLYDGVEKDVEDPRALTFDEALENEYRTHKKENFAMTYTALRWINMGGTVEEVKEELMLRSMYSLLRSADQDTWIEYDTYYNNENALEETFARSDAASASGNDELANLILESAMDKSAFVMKNHGANYYIGNMIEPIQEFIDTHGVDGIRDMSLKDIVFAAKDIVNENLMSYEHFTGDINKSGYSFKNAIHETRLDVNGELIFHPDIAKHDPNFIKFAMEAKEHFGFEFNEKDDLLPSIKSSVPRWMKNADLAAAPEVAPNSPAYDSLAAAAPSTATDLVADKGLNLDVVDQYLNAAWSQSADVAEKVAINVKFQDGGSPQEVYISADIAEELSAAASKAHPKDRSIVLLKDGEEWRGLSEREWKVKHKELKASGELYTVIKDTKDGFAAMTYEGNKLARAEGIRPVVLYDNQGQVLQAEFEGLQGPQGTAPELPKNRLDEQSMRVG